MLEFSYILGRETDSNVKSSWQNFVSVLKILEFQVKRHQIVDNFFHQLKLSSTHGYHSLYTSHKLMLYYAFTCCKELFIGSNCVMCCLD